MKNKTHIERTSLKKYCLYEHLCPSRNTTNIPMEFLINILFPFMNKVRSPPYCCTVILDSRLVKVSTTS